MLVLSRQRDETIMIGDDIEITVVDIRGDKVRLGIAAPSKIAVHRKEVYESIRRENEEAARIVQTMDISPLQEMKPVTGVSPGPSRLRVAKAITQPGPGESTAARLVGTQGTAPSKVPRAPAAQARAAPAAGLRKAV
jgi:carbon storage regulator